MEEKLGSELLGLGEEERGGARGLPGWGRLTLDSPWWGAVPSEGCVPQVRVWSCLAAVDWLRLGV